MFVVFIFICYSTINVLSDYVLSIMSTSFIYWDVYSSCYTLVLSHILINIDPWKFWAYYYIKVLLKLVHGDMPTG